MKTLLTLFLLLSCTAAAAQRDKADKAELKRLQVTLDSCKNASAEQHRRDSALIDSLKGELQALAMFRDEFVKDRLLKSRPDLSLPCSQASDALLSSFLDRLTPFRADSLVDSVAASVERYQQLCQTFDALEAPLNSPYHKDSIKTAYNNLLSLEKQEGVSPAQAAEFHHTAVVLSKYVHCARIVQGIINDIDKELEPYLSATGADTQSFCVDQVKAVVSRAVQNDPADSPRYKYINEIPYLGQRFNAYLSCMTSTPLNVTPEALAAKTELLNIKID